MHLAIDIGVGRGLIDTIGAGGAHPGAAAVGGADLREHAKKVASAEDDEDAAGVLIAASEDGAVSAGLVAEAECGLHPEAGLEPGLAHDLARRRTADGGRVMAMLRDGAFFGQSAGLKQGGCAARTAGDTGTEQVD